MKNSNKKLSGNKTLITLLLLLFTIISIKESNAQFKPSQEIGIIGGTSYYIGDLNSTHFSNLQVGGGLTFRKNFDRRFTFKSSAIYSSIKGDDRKSSDPEKINRNLHFKSDIIELSGQIEFNFLPFETGNPLYTWTPFVFAGVSLYHYNPKAESDAGEWVELQPLGTEGQGTTAFPTRKKYSLTQLSIPFGGGMKIAVNENFNIIFEYGLRKAFTDYLDDVSTTYAGIPADFDPITIELSDRSLDGPHAAGDQRGNSPLGDNDWYSFSGITLSFTLQNNTKDCDY